MSKEASSGDKVSTLDDVEDLDDQQFIVLIQHCLCIQRNVRNAFEVEREIALLDKEKNSDDDIPKMYFSTTLLMLRKADEMNGVARIEAIQTSFGICIFHGLHCLSDGCQELHSYYGNITEDVICRKTSLQGFEDSLLIPNKVYQSCQGTVMACIKPQEQVYVDDIIFGSTKSSMVKDFEELMQKEFKMSSMGELTFFLGLQVKQSNGAFYDSDYAGDNTLIEDQLQEMSISWKRLGLLAMQETNNCGYLLYRGRICSSCKLLCSGPKFSCRITLWTPSMLGSCTSIGQRKRNIKLLVLIRSGCQVLQGDAQGTPPQSAAHSHRMLLVQGKLRDSSGKPISKLNKESSPKQADETVLTFRPAAAGRHPCFLGRDQNLISQKRRRKKHKKKVSSVKLGRNKDEGTLSEEHNVQEEDTAHPFFDDIVDKDAAVTPDLERKSDETEEVNIEEKEKLQCKSGEIEGTDWMTTQSTARQGTITPRTLKIFETKRSLEHSWYHFNLNLYLNKPSQATDRKVKGNGDLAEMDAEEEEKTDSACLTKNRILFHLYRVVEDIMRTFLLNWLLGFDVLGCAYTRDRSCGTMNSHAAVEIPLSTAKYFDLLTASMEDYILYQMEYKSAFLYGIIDEEVYMSQPPSFVDPKFPKKVYKVVKVLYSLHQATRSLVCCGVLYIRSTKRFLCDEFEALFGKSRFQMSLWRATFFLGLQVTNRRRGLIIRYLKGKPKLGLGILGCPYIDLEAYQIVTLLEQILTRNSPLTGGYLFLAGDLFHGIAKRSQQFVASSTTRVEFVAADQLAGWASIMVSNQMDAYEKKLIQVMKIHTDDNVVDLLTKAFDVSRQALQEDTQLPQTSVPIPNVADEAVFKEWDDRLVRATTTVASLDAAQASRNITKTQSIAMSNDSLSQEIGSGDRPKCQEAMGEVPRNDEGRPDLHELMDICTTMFDRVLDLEKEKDAQVVEILKLKNKIKKLERKAKSSIPPPKRRLYNNQIEEFNLSNKGNGGTKVFDDTIAAKKDVNAAEPVSTAGDAGTAASVIPDIDTAGPSNVSVVGPSTGTVRDIFEDEMMTIADTLMAINSTRPRTTSVVINDVEEELRRATPVLIVQSQEKEQRIARERAAGQDVKDAALIAEFDNVQARIEADALLAARLQEEEEKEYLEEIQKLYEREKKWINDSVLIDSEEGGKKAKSSKKEAASSKKRQKVDLDDENVKRQKIGEALVKERFNTTEPTDDKEKELWVELKGLFEQDNDDILWMLQRGHDIIMLVEKEYALTRGTLGLMMMAKLLVEADSEMSREL
ncbi:uncharacterized mitochondrial protein-like protein [Tanacetum coccineum]